jgi:hypothetical protein
LKNNVKEKLAVIIPVYNSAPSENELVSFRSIIRNLSSKKLIFLTFSNLDLSIFLEELIELDCSASIEYFKEYYFESTESYNELLLSKQFYQRFENYEFILICQLDTYIFSNSVDEWINKGYSYIGAPWIKESPNGFEIFGVGNGGLSLRKVSDQLSVFSIKYLFPKLILALKFNLKYREMRVRSFKMFWSRIIRFQINRVFNPLFYIKKNEDVVWSKLVPIFFPEYQIAEKEDALRFSFETSPRHCFELNHHRLPFGCHAWDKQDFGFWKEIIEESIRNAVVKK